MSAAPRYTASPFAPRRRLTRVVRVGDVAIGGSVRADRVWLLFVLGIWSAMALEQSLAPDEPLAARGA